MNQGWKILWLRVESGPVLMESSLSSSGIGEQLSMLTLHSKGFVHGC